MSDVAANTFQEFLPEAGVASFVIANGETLFVHSLVGLESGELLLPWGFESVPLKADLLQPGFPVRT